MLRKFTKDVGPRFKKGNTHNFPRDVWKSIATSAKAPLDNFTEAVEYDPTMQSVLKGRGAIQHKRLGT